MKETQNEDQELTATPFLNFNVDGTSGKLNEEWARRKERTFFVEFNITNNLKRDILHLMVIHSNLQEHTHLSRVLYQEKIGKYKSIQTVSEWPVFKYAPQFYHRLLDSFQIQFCLEEENVLGKKRVKQQYGNTQKMEGIFPDKQDQRYEINIQISEYNDSLYIQIYYQPKFGKSSKELWGRSHLKERDTIFMENLIKQNHKENKQAIELLKKQLKDLDSDITLNNDYCFLAKHILENQKTYSLQQKLEGQFATLDQLLKEIQDKQKKEDEILNPKQNYPKEQEIPKAILSFVYRMIKLKEMEDVCMHQGTIGNCYFIAAIDQIITKADYLLDKIWILQNKQKDKAVAILNIDGKMSPIRVNFRLSQEKYQDVLKYSHMNRLSNVTKNKRLKNIERAMLLDKCLVKIFGSDRQNSGDSLETFMILTNQPGSRLRLYDYNKNEALPKLVENLIQWNSEQNQVKQYENQKYSLNSKKKNQNDTIAEPEKSFLPLQTRLIVVNIKQQSYQRLLQLFKKSKNSYYLDQQIIKKFTKHCYSFQGIYPNKPYDEQKKKQYYVKVRDLRDHIASFWRKAWLNLHSKEDFQFIHQEKGATIVLKQNKVMFECMSNQFILSLEQLLSLNPSIDTCICHLKAHFTSIPVIMTNSQSSNFQITLNKSLKFLSIQEEKKKEEGQKLKKDKNELKRYYFTLHQKNQRRIKQTIKQDAAYKIEKIISSVFISGWNMMFCKDVIPKKQFTYLQPKFQLNLQRIGHVSNGQYRIPFEPQLKKSMFNSFYFDFEEKYSHNCKLRIRAQLEKKYEMCYVSVLSVTQGHDIILSDYNNPLTLPIHYIKYQKQFRRQLVFGNQCHEYNFLIENNDNQPVITCIFDMESMSRNEIKSVIQELRMFFYKIPENSSENNEIYSMFQSTGQETIIVNQLYIIFRSKMISNYLDEGNYVFRISFQGQIEKNKKYIFTAIIDLEEYNPLEQSKMINQSEQQNNQKSSIDFPPVITNKNPNLNYEEAQATKATGSKKNQPQEKKEGKTVISEDYEFLFQEQTEDKKFEDKQVSEK